MRGMLVLLSVVAGTCAQVPDHHLLLGGRASSTQAALYVYSSQSGVSSRVYPAAGASVQYRDAVKACRFSPDGSQIAAYMDLDWFLIINRDGTNAREITLSVPFKVSNEVFSWTTQGIFWVDEDTDRLYRYVPETNTLTTVTTFEVIPNTTSFGGLHASRDGSRLWSWLTLAHMPENYDGMHPEGKPFVFIDNNDYTNPRIRYAHFWGHGNVMLPDGSLTLHTGWENSNSTHPYLWTWNWDTFAQGATYTPGLAEVGELVQVANNSEWVGINAGTYLYRFAAPGATPQAVTNPLSGWHIEQFWFGDFSGQTPWYIATPELELDSTTPSGTVAVSGWTDAGNPAVQDDAVWLPAPTITRSGSSVSLHYTVSNPPTVTDTATVSVTDASQVTRTCRVVWKVSVPLDEQLQVQTTVDSVSVRISWTNTLGAGYSFRMQKFTGTSWGAPQVVATSYADMQPAEGDNRYRLAAVSAADTMYAEISAYYSAPASLTILSPSDGQQVNAGAQVTLTWQAVKVEAVVVEFSVDDGDTWTLLTTSAVHPDDETWANLPFTIPSEGAQAVLLRIHPYQHTDPVDVISLTVGTASVTSPRSHVSPRTRGPDATGVVYDLRGRRALVALRPVRPAVPVIEGSACSREARVWVPAR